MMSLPEFRVVLLYVLQDMIPRLSAALAVLWWGMAWLTAGLWLYCGSSCFFFCLSWVVRIVAISCNFMRCHGAGEQPVVHLIGLNWCTWGLFCAGYRLPLSLDVPCALACLAACTVCVGVFDFSGCGRDRFFLFLLLVEPNLDRDVKPVVLACLGDIALAIQGEFRQYLEVRSVVPPRVKVLFSSYRAVAVLLLLVVLMDPSPWYSLVLF